jgi:hypothetical protein
VELKVSPEGDVIAMSATSTAVSVTVAEICALWDPHSAVIVETPGPIPVKGVEVKEPSVITHSSSTQTSPIGAMTELTWIVTETSGESGTGTEVCPFVVPTSRREIL